MAAEVQQLETDFGLDVRDADRVYFVAPEKLDVPAVILDNVERVWQYRCYLPPNYDFKRFRGHGLICADGYYCKGGRGMSHSSPKSTAVNERVTVSVTRKQDHFVLGGHFAISVCLGNRQDRGTLRCRDFENAKIEDFVIEPVLASGEKARSFGRDEIIPILRIYDPASADEKMVAGRKQMTYRGALLTFCPTSQLVKFESLRKGELITEPEASEGSSP